MHVLITGGGGFIGSHLVESQLEQGHRVRAIDSRLDRLSHLGGDSRLEVVSGDMTHDRLVRETVQGVDVIYHLASAHLEISTPAARYVQVNIAATENLLAAARSARVARVVHCSSVGVFGDLATLPASEATPCRPTNIYGRTKLAGERAALDQGRQSGLPVVVVRPAWVYGPRCPRTHKLFHAIRRGRFVMVGSGETLRQPLYVADAVRGLELCAQLDAAVGQVYILAGNQTVTIKELVHTIAGIVDAPPPGLRVPVLAAKAVGLGLEMASRVIGREPPFSRRSTDFFLQHNAYDISKARRELAFQPRVDLKEGIGNTWRYLSAQQEPRPIHLQPREDLA